MARTVCFPRRPDFRPRIGVCKDADPRSVRMNQSPRALWLFFVATVFSVGITSSAVQAQDLGIPVNVENPTDVDRFNEPVASGSAVPPSANLYDPNLVLRMVDSAGQPVPVEFNVLSRWHGKREDVTKTAKWALIKFLADVPANQTATYYIQFGARATGSITRDDSATEIQVNTGTAEFVIDKQSFSFLKSVKVGATIVTGAPGRVDVRDTAGNLLDLSLASTVVEDAGDVRTVVRQKGSITGLGLDFTIRYFFWSGRSDVKVEFRLENQGSYGEVYGMGSSIQHAWFEDVNLTLTLNQDDGDIVTSEQDIASQGAAFELRQDFGQTTSNLDMLSGFKYSQTLSGVALSGGGRYSGALALNGSTASIGVAVDRFWQNFPKSLSSNADEISVGLWPAFGSGPVYYGQWGTPASANIDVVADDFYRFEGGRWKTYVVNIDFKVAGNFSPSDVAASAKRINKPLMALLPLGWPFRFFAFGHPLIERREWNDTARDRYEQIVQVLADDDAADDSPLGKIGLPEFRNRGGTYGGGQFFGWTNFGDLIWGDGYCSNHYDLPWSILINYYRTGDYKFFDVGRDIANHRRDYDQFHSTDPSIYRRGGQFYEKGWTHGNFRSPTHTHTWVNGLLIKYILTGDEGAREAALEVGDFLVRGDPGNWDGVWGARILGWEVEGLMNLYNYIGDPVYLQTAQEGVAQWEVLELSFGGGGYVLNNGWSTPTNQSWMHAIVLSAIGKYYLTTLDPSVLPVMQRMADWFLVHAVAELPTGAWNNRTTGKIWEFYDGTDHWGASVHHQWAVIDALGYAAVALHDQNFMMVSQSLFESVTRYFQGSSGDSSPKNYWDSDSFSAISFKPAQFATSETKALSNMALWGQSHLAFEALWEGYF